MELPVVRVKYTKQEREQMAVRRVSARIGRVTGYGNGGRQRWIQMTRSHPIKLVFERKNDRPDFIPGVEKERSGMRPGVVPERVVTGDIIN